MGSETSELVMALLEELATLKELDVKPNPTEGEDQAYRLRRQRHDEITSEIKGLAKQSPSRKS